MPLLEAVKIPTIDPSALYAVVGVGDLAIEKVREVSADLTARADKARADLSSRADKTRAELDPAKLQTKAGELADEAGNLPTKLADLFMSIPATAAEQATAVSEFVTEGYEDLSSRGKKLVTRVRTQKATEDLVAQANTTIASAKGAVTTAMDAADQVQRSAKATVTTGRHQATKLANAVLSSGEDEVQIIKGEATEAAKKTVTSAKRTNTTAKRAMKRTTTAAKSTTTSARKTAASAKKAAAATAEKVGD